MKLRQQRRRAIKAMRDLTVLPAVGEPQVWLIHSDVAGNRSQPVKMTHEGLNPNREYVFSAFHTDAGAPTLSESAAGKGLVTSDVSTDFDGGKLTSWVTQASKLGTSNTDLSRMPKGVREQLS